MSVWAEVAGKCEKRSGRRSLLLRFSGEGWQFQARSEQGKGGRGWELPFPGVGRPDRLPETTDRRWQGWRAVKCRGEREKGFCFVVLPPLSI